MANAPDAPRPRGTIDSTDALSAILKSVHLEGAHFVDAEFTAPWCVRARYGLGGIRARLAHPEHVVFFHFVAEGGCRIRLEQGAELVEVVAGDLILFPHDDDTQLLGSDLHLAPVDVEQLMGASGPMSDVMQIRHGGGGAVTRFICGYVGCSRSLCRTLFEGLPRMLRIPLGDAPTARMLRELLRVGVHESATARPGGQSMLAKLAELIFIEALRRFVDDLSPHGKGWLAGVRDPHVGRALGLLHREPGKAWTVQALAREVALSRSALAERFSALVGEPPIQYLKRWRLALAAHRLRSGREAIARIAERIGYESEAAFNRAFKREFGKPPATWRRNLMEAPGD